MMRKLVHLLFTLSFLVVPFTVVDAASERFKPFVLASTSQGDFDGQVLKTKASLEGAGFTVLGEFTPYKDTFVENTRVIVVTSDELVSVAGQTKYGGFAAPWRVAVTQVDGEIQVAYANPVYLSHAYRLNSDLSGVTEALRTALGVQSTFGSKKGLTARKLKKYKYTFGMERFNKVYKLAQYGSHADAVAAVEQNLADNVAGVSKVYRLDMPNNVTVFGVARKAPSDDAKNMDDQFIMSIVDFREHKGTAYLPYEIMVDGNKVVALHMRFRMAVQYPDLKMMGDNSFMKLMKSPNAIQKALKQVAGG
jgi:hypothetical protein